MIRTTLYLALLSLFSFSVACSDSPCSEDVIQDLLDRCGLQIGAVSGSICSQFSSSESEQLALRQTVCEIGDPDLDVECLRNEACEEILFGACGNDSDDPAPADASCIHICQTTALDCESACVPASGSFSQCSDCSVDCQERFEACTDACS
ncbi:MAG: hypothetical protein AAF627_19115 [Myxococcota bacterium]